MKKGIFPLLLSALFLSSPLTGQQEEAKAAPSADHSKLEEQLEEFKKNAEAGDAQAMRQISLHYAAYGLEEKARTWHERYLNQVQSEADGGNAESMLRLARLYLRGDEMTLADPVLAQKYFKQAADSGHPGAAYILADFYEKANNTQDSKHYYQLAYNLYTERSKSEEKDIQTDAIYWLGIMQLYGQACEKNEEEAIKLLHQAADKGNHQANLRLFQHYVYAKQMDKAFAIARILADEAHDGRMAFLVACSYLEGKDVPLDKALGEQYLALACKLANADALYYQALRYKEQGETDKAIASFDSASQQGHTGALVELAQLFMDSDSEKALQQLELAANLYSSPQAALLLAQYYDKNDDTEKANAWYVIASDRGVREAAGPRGLLHFIPHSNIDWNPTLGYQWWRAGSEAGDELSTRYLNIFYYGIIPAVLIIAFLAPILFVRLLLKRKSKREKKK